MKDNKDIQTVSPLIMGLCATAMANCCKFRTTLNVLISSGDMQFRDWHRSMHRAQSRTTFRDPPRGDSPLPICPIPPPLYFCNFSGQTCNELFLTGDKLILKNSLFK